MKAHSLLIVEALISAGHGVDHRSDQGANWRVEALTTKRAAVTVAEVAVLAREVQPA